MALPRGRPSAPGDGHVPRGADPAVPRPTASFGRQVRSSQGPRDPFPSVRSPGPRELMPTAGTRRAARGSSTAVLLCGTGALLLLLEIPDSRAAGEAVRDSDGDNRACGRPRC